MKEYYPCIKKLVENNIVGCALEDLIHSNFCKHRNVNGKYKNEICLCKSKNNNGCCSKHSIKDLKNAKE